MAVDPVMNNMEVRAAAVSFAASCLVESGIRAFVRVMDEQWEPTPSMKNLTLLVEHYIKEGHW